MWVCLSWATVLNCDLQPDSAASVRMRVVPGLSKYRGKGVLSSSLEVYVGDPDISPVPQQGQYPPNTFLRINPIPFALHSFPLSSPGQCPSASSCPLRSNVLELQPFTRMWLLHVLLAVSCRNTPFPLRNYMTIKLRGTVTFQVSLSSPLFPCLTLLLRNLVFDCEFWPGNEFDGSILKRQLLTGCGQHPNIVLRRLTNTSCLAYVLNELVDRHAFIFPVPVCNQPRKNFLDLLFFCNFCWGPWGNEGWNSNAAVERTSLSLLICGAKMGWQHQIHGSLTGTHHPLEVSGCSWCFP